jgi:chemotaxis signal transduction protein
MHSLGEARRYGIEKLHQDEIVGILDVFRFASDDPLYLQSGIEVNGKILPLLDLRSAEGALSYDERACIILLASTHGEPAGIVGLVVQTIDA